MPSPADVDVSRRRFVDLRPLTSSPAFARLWIGSTIAGIGSQMTIVAVGLHVFALTGSTVAVALVGGIALVPMIVAGLYGGMLADAFDRRAVLIGSSLVAWSTTIGLVVFAAVELSLGRQDVWPLYLLTTLNAVASTVSASARGSVTPRLLPPELVPAASALGGIGFGAQLTLGPALGGVLVAAAGFAWTYAVDVVLFTAGFLGILALPRLPPLARTARPRWASVREGFAFLRRAPNIRMSFLVDIVAMTFGRPHVLFPAVGALAIGGGAVIVGALTAAGAVGVLLSSLLSGPVGRVHRHGVAIGWSIAVYGAFVALFGLAIAIAPAGLAGEAPLGEWGLPDDGASRPVDLAALVLALLALAGMGASDNVSSIFRQTILLTAAPDEMRGRLQGVFTVVVTGGPRVGDLYMGLLAGVLALWVPPVAGGLAIIVLIALLLRAQHSFREYDARAPEL